MNVANWITSIKFYSLYCYLRIKYMELGNENVFLTNIPPLARMGNFRLHKERSDIKVTQGSVSKLS